MKVYICGLCSSLVPADYTELHKDYHIIVDNSLNQATSCYFEGFPIRLAELNDTGGVINND